MPSFFQNARVIASLSLLFPVIGFGCHVLAGIEDRETRSGSGGAGGSSSSTSSSGGVGGNGGGGTSSSGGGLTCFDKGAPHDPSCANYNCQQAGDPMTDKCGCGNCPHDCGEALCNGGRCDVVPMATVSQFAYAVATNGNAVYWASFIDGTPPHSYIHRLDFGDKDVTMPKILAEVEGTVRVLVADCENVYFAITDVVEEKIQYVGAEAQGGTPKDIAPGFIAKGVSAMAVDDRFLYFSITDNNVVQGVQAWPKGGKVTFLAPTAGRARSIVARNGFVYWTDEGNGQPNSGQIKRMRIPAGDIPWPPVADIVRKSAGNPQGLAVDQGFVYWIDVGDMQATLQKAVNTSGGPMMMDPPANTLAKLTTTINSQFPSNWLSVDDINVYFLEIFNGVGRIGRVNKNEPMPQPPIYIADGDNTPGGLSVYSFVSDPTRLYIAAPGGQGTNSRLFWVAK